MSEHQLQIALDGVIQLLARSLYSDPDVFVRELIQNAHDAIIKRRILDPGAPAGRVLIAVNGKRIVVDDNGAGLTEEELHEHLSTIGRSGTRGMKTSFHTHHEVLSMIGQFGIGLLSTFLVADRVTVETRSKEGPALRWVSGGGRSYKVEPGQRAEVGTTVTLDIKPAAEGYLHPGKLRRIVTRYTDLLPVPVYVVPERNRPVNRGRPPWEVTGPPEKLREVYRRWWFERFGAPPAAVFRLRVEVGIGDVRGVVSGLLGYPSERGTGELHLDVYVSNVFITSRNRNLVPERAGPLAGILATELLAPNAARDDVMGDPMRDAVRDAIGEALLRHITQASGLEREDLLQALHVHAEHLLPLLAELPDDLLLSLGPSVRVKTDRGDRLLGEIVDASPVASDGVTEVHGSDAQDKPSPVLLLCAAREIPVVDLSDPVVASLVERYLVLVAARLVRVDLSGGSSLLVPLRQAQQEAYQPLLMLCSDVLAEENCTVEIVRFAPAEIAALRIEQPNEEGELVTTLYLNADCPSVRLLRERPDDDITFSAIRLIHAGALLLGGAPLERATLHRLFTDTHRAVAALLGLL